MTSATRVEVRAMSTDVTITIVGGDQGPAQSAQWAQHRIAELESLWSRFVHDSDISRLNRAAGAPIDVAPETVTAVRAACAAWAFTGGRFDPTVHDSLLRLGYDDTIDIVRRRGSVAAGSAPVPAPGCTGIVFDTARSIVQLPAGVRLDLGGIGKGLAADDIATGLLARGATGAMVNIGGDVRVIGTPSESAAWRVEIEDPRTDTMCAMVELLDGGVATSTTLRRRWMSGRRSVHHLIDPATGNNASSVVGATVVAGTAAWADALSKLPFVDDHLAAGSFDAASALVIREDGTTETIGSVRFERAVAA